MAQAKPASLQENKEAKPVPLTDKNAPEKPARRLSKRVSGLSIKDALAGKFKEEKISSIEQHEMYTKAGEIEEFTLDDLKLKWNEFVARLEDRPAVYSSLSRLPALGKNYQLVLDIENNVQENMINAVKPELVSWLRKSLRNSAINLSLRITEIEKEKIIYSDSEKYDELVKKNPALALLKQRLNLDFGE